MVVVPKPNPSLRIISQSEYEAGLESPLHPTCLARSEVYVARLRTAEREYYAIEFAQVIMRVERVENGYHVTVAQPQEERWVASLTWRFDGNGLRRGLANQRKGGLPDGYFVTEGNAWDDSLAALIANELVLR